MNSNPFDHNKFVGYVSRVTPELTRVHFPGSYLLKKFYFEGNVLHSGIVRNYVIIEGEGYGFLGRIVRVELSEKERLSLNQAAFQRSDANFHPTGDVEILLAFSIFSEIKAKKGLEQYPPIGSRVYACSPEYLQLFLKDFGHIDNEIDDLLDIAVLPQDEDHSVRISANSIFGRHCAIVGTTGGGKSYTVAKLIQEMLRKAKPVKILLLDSTGEYHKLAASSQCINLTFGRNGDTYFHHKELTESDLFSLFRPAGQVQMPSLQSAIKSLKLARILEEKKKEESFDYPHFYKSGFIEKVGEIGNFETLLQENSPRINSESADFDIEKLPEQIEYECIWPTDRYNTTKWGSKNDNALTNCASLITRIKGRLGNTDFSEAFGLTLASRNDKKTFNEVFDEFYNGEQSLLRIDISKVGFEENLREVLVNTIGRFFLSRFQNTQTSFRERPVVFFVDEAHQLFRVQRIKDEYSNEFRLDSFERIAKETRKQGLFLCLATQRPRDIPHGVLSQMGTFIVHRLINPLDREAINSASPEGSRYLLSFLPSLGQGEALLFGVDFPMPVNLKITKVPDEFKPDSDTPKLFL